MQPSFQMGGGTMFLGAGIILLLVLIPWIISAIWVYRDAKYRTTSPVLFVLAVQLVCWPISLVVWLIVRPKEQRLMRGDRKM